MADGFKTQIAFQQEAAPLGDLTGDIFALVGKVQFFGDRVIASEHQHLDAFRRVRTDDVVHLSYRIGFEAELSPNACALFFLKLIFRQEFIDTLLTYRALRGNEAVPTLAFFANFDNGQKWAFTGAALASLEFEVNARKIIRLRANMVALQGAEIEAMPTVTITEVSGPLPATSAALYGSTESDWEPPANPMGSAEMATLRFQREIDPAQFGDDGKPTRHAYIGNWVSGGDFRAMPSAALLSAFMLGVEAKGKLAVTLGTWQFSFPLVRFELSTQPFLDPRLIKSTVEWAGFGDPTFALPVAEGDDDAPTCAPHHLDVIAIIEGVSRSGHPERTIDGRHRCVWGQGLDLGQTGRGKRFINDTYSDALTFVRVECDGGGYYATAYDTLTGPMDGQAGLDLYHVYAFGGLNGWTTGTIRLHVSPP